MYLNNKCLQRWEMRSWAFQKQEQRHTGTKHSLLVSVHSVLVRLFLPPLILPEGEKENWGVKIPVRTGKHFLPIFLVYGQSIEILPFKFKIFVRLEVLSEWVGQDSTIYLQVVFFFLFNFGSCKVHCLMHAIFCNLHHCSLEIKRKASLAQQKSASPPQNLLSQNEGGRGLGWGGKGGKQLSAQQQFPLSAELQWCQLSDYKLLIYASTAAKSSK